MAATRATAASSQTGRPTNQVPASGGDEWYSLCVAYRCAWRMLPHDLPPWRTTFHYFRIWRRDGTWERIHEVLRDQLRLAEGRAVSRTGYMERDEIRVAWLESASAHIPQHTLLRIPEGGIPQEVLAEAVKETRFEGVAQAAAWVWAETGNFFLDNCYEDGAYDGFAYPWEDEVIADGTEEWRKARAVLDSVYQLSDWLEEDLSSRFAEMLEFILERLGNSNPTTDENDHE